MARLRVPISAADHVRGPADAPVTLVEYGDYQCPHCAMAYPIVELVQKHFGRQLRFVFRHFPLTEVHPLAGPAAETAEFAGAEGLFWEMHGGLYENQERLSWMLFGALAEAMGLSETQLRGALAAGQYLPKVRADFLGGVRSGVNGTPSFFVNGEKHEGSYAYEDLVTAVDMHLRAGAHL